MPNPNVYDTGEDDAETKEAPAAEEEDSQKTALLPKSMFPGDCKPGDKYTIEIVHSYDDEKEVKIVGDKAESKKEEESEMDKSMSKMDSLAE